MRAFFRWLYVGRKRPRAAWVEALSIFSAILMGSHLIVAVYGLGLSLIGAWALSPPESGADYVLPGIWIVATIAFSGFPIVLFYGSYRPARFRIETLKRLLTWGSLLSLLVFPFAVFTSPLGVVPLALLIPTFLTHMGCWVALRDFDVEDYFDDARRAAG